MNAKEKVDAAQNSFFRRVSAFALALFFFKSNLPVRSIDPANTNRKIAHGRILELSFQRLETHRKQ